jgi:hypothetical protein
MFENWAERVANARYSNSVPAGSVQREDQGAEMRDKPGNPVPHPDDYMVVTLTIEFRAKLNPEVEDPPPFDMTELEYTPPTDEAADYLEKVINAIRQRRLYGFMVQEIAESAVGAGDWIEKTTAEVLAEARAHGEEQTIEKRSPNETDSLRDE